MKYGEIYVSVLHTGDLVAQSRLCSRFWDRRAVELHRSSIEVKPQKSDIFLGSYEYLVICTW